MEDTTEDALAAPSLPQGLPSHTPTSDTQQTTTAQPAAHAVADKPQAAKRKRVVAPSKASGGSAARVDGDEPLPVVTPRRRQASKTGRADATPAEALAAAVQAVTGDAGGKPQLVKRQRVKASEVAVSTEVQLLEAMPANGMSRTTHQRDLLSFTTLLGRSLLLSPPKT